MKTTVRQTAESIQFQFNQYKSDLTQFNGTTAQKFTEINQYIRFVSGDIVLGKESNPLTLRISHDRIQFLEQGVEIAYWQNRKFYAVDGEFLHSLKLGKFAFIPRATGNLSFTKVVE